MRDQCGLFKILTSFIRLQKDGADLDAIPCTVTRKKNRRLEINLPSQSMHAPAKNIYAMHNFCRAITFLIKLKMNDVVLIPLIDTTLIPVSCIRAHFWLSGSM